MNVPYPPKVDGPTVRGSIDDKGKWIIKWPKKGGKDKPPKK